MNKKHLILLLIVLWCYSPSYAEFYKYKDENGVTRFTDNIAEIPKDQRPKVKSYVESDDYLSEEEKAQRDKNADITNKQDDEAVDEQKAARKSQVESLRTRRADLSKEYQDILNTKEQLDKERTAIMKPEATAEARKAFDDKVDKFNKRTEAYEKNQAKYQKELEVFNKQIETFNKK